MDITLIITISIIVGTIFFFIGSEYGRSKEIDARVNLPGPVNTLSVSEIEPRRSSTRYVRIDKEDLHSTNDAIEMFEEDGYNVTDYDAEDGIITMEKYITQPKKSEVDAGQQTDGTYFSPTPAARGGSSSIIPIPIL